MKKILVSLLAAATVGGAFAQSAFPDVPENHWAGGAVDRIADLGIVIGFPDGTFRGNEAFTRYQASLVVSRLLDVIGQEFDARQALTDADLAALANALQDLTARVANNEGTIASVADGVAVNSARLDGLEGLLSGDEDLANALAAQRVAIDTALAQAEAAAALAQDAMDAARAAANRAAQNADAISSLSWLTNDLDGRVTALENAPAAGGATDLSGVNADIANIREFVILLRRDQVALRNQVAGLAEQTDVNTADIADLQDRVAELELNAITFSGSINVNYRVDRMSGDENQFDVDRAYGLGLPRTMGSGSTFSSGTLTASQETTASIRRAEHYADIGTRFRQPVAATLNLDVTFNRVFDGQGNPNALNDFEAVVDLYLRPADLSRGTTNFTGYVFGVRNFTGTFAGIGQGAPIVFTFGEEVSVAYTPYVFRFDEVPGFTATVNNPFEFLNFLNPTIQVAYLSDLNVETAAGSGIFRDITARGARLTVSPFEGVTIGASFAQQAEFTNIHDDLDANNYEQTVWGVDAAAAISIFSLNGEFASASDSATPSDSHTLYYVQAGVDTENIPVLNSLSANYRSIPAAWSEGSWNQTGGRNPGLIDDDSAYPFQEDQTGFGVNASLGLWILDLDAYFNSYTTSVDSIGTTDDAAIMAFGVDVSAELFRAVSLTGFFHMANVDGNAVDSTRRPYLADDTAATDGATRVDRDGTLDTGFGIGLAHDGTAENALVPALNISAVYSQLEADFGRTVIDVDADYTLSLGFLTLTPYVSFDMASSADNSTRQYDAFNRTQLGAGTGIETQQFDFFLRPSLVGAVNYRSASYTNVYTPAATAGAAGTAVADYDAYELQYSVGLAFNEFLFDNSVLTVRYAAWQGENVDATVTAHSTASRGLSASRIHDGDVNNGLWQYVNGYEAIWDYHDLQLSYGVYLSDEGPSRLSAGQVFRIRYTVNF